MDTNKYPQTIYATADGWGRDTYYESYESMQRTIALLKDAGGADWDGISIDDCEQFHLEGMHGEYAIYRQSLRGGQEYFAFTVGDEEGSFVHDNRASGFQSKDLAVAQAAFEIGLSFTYDDAAATFEEAKAYAVELHAQKEQDFWSHPDTVNLYEGNAGDLYVGQEWGPWFRMDNSAGKTTFANDARNYTLYVGSEDWGPEAAEETSPVEYTKIVAEYRDGRTRYTFDAYTTSAAPGLAAREYVGPDAEGYEPDDE